MSWMTASYNCMTIAVTGSVYSPPGYGGNYNPNPSTVLEANNTAKLAKQLAEAEKKLNVANRELAEFKKEEEKAKLVAKDVYGPDGKPLKRIVAL